MAVYNAKPQPRLLAIDFEEQELVDAGIPKLFPTIKTIEDHQINEVDQLEFDVVLVAEGDEDIKLDPRLYVVAIGGELPIARLDKEGKRTMPAYRNGGSVSTEFEIRDSLPSELHNLARDSLVPSFKNEVSHKVLYGVRLNTLVDLWTPLINDTKGNVLAGYYKIAPNHSSEYWYLPAFIEKKALNTWLKELVKKWRVQAPDIFQASEDWHLKEKWQTRGEKKIADQIINHREKFEAARQKYEKKLVSLQDQLNTEIEAANTNYRSLVTSQSDELKYIVKAALESLGFRVKDSDTETVNPGELLEDLQIETVNGWIALAEVRGYKKGAQLKDLLRIARFVSRYQQSSGGDPPSASWYIVNHFIESPPDQRAVVLQAHDPEVRIFGDSKGLIIDTRELLKLVLAVDKRMLTSGDARKLLLESSGRFVYKK